MFDWVSSSVEDCAWHIAKTSPQGTNSVIVHHERQGNVEVVAKIKEARLLAKKYRILLKADKIKEELKEE